MTIKWIDFAEKGGKKESFGAMAGTERENEKVINFMVCWWQQPKKRQYQKEFSSYTAHISPFVTVLDSLQWTLSQNPTFFRECRNCHLRQEISIRFSPQTFHSAVALIGKAKITAWTLVPLLTDAKVLENNWMQKLHNTSELLQLKQKNKLKKIFEVEMKSFP